MDGASQIRWLVILKLVHICGASSADYFYATHFWPLQNRSNGHFVYDKVGTAKGDTHAAAFMKNDRLGGAVSLRGRGMQWIAFTTRQFRENILATPDFCKFGLSLGFWIRFRGGKYILSTGGLTNSTEGTGFQIIYENESEKFVAFAKTKEKVWRAETEAYKNTWCYVMMTWSNGNGLMLYVDTKLMARDRSGSSVDTKARRFSQMLTIASPPDLTRLNEFGNFDMAHLGVWNNDMTGDRLISAPEFSLKRLDETEDCKKKKEACIKDPCGKECLLDYTNAVCLEFIHISCKGNATTTKGPPVTDMTTAVHQGAKSVKTKQSVATFVSNFTSSGIAHSRNLTSSQLLTNASKVEVITNAPNFTYLDPAYRRASNYYHLNKDILVDIRGQSTVKMTPRGFNVVKTSQLGKVISLNGRDESIQIQTREQSCITNPDLCSNGLSIGFWLLMKGGKYIMSAGTYGEKSQGSGFKIYEDVNSSNFKVLLSTTSKKWTAVIHKIPFHKWFHFLLTWSKNTGLKIFINGVFVLEGSLFQTVKLSKTDVEKFAGITIANPEKLEQVIDIGHFDIGHLSIWKYVLSGRETAEAYKASIRTSAADKRCCKMKSETPCAKDPCLKFRKPSECEDIFKKFKCICPQVKSNRICSNLEKTGTCIDRRPDCGILAAQHGYCDYFQQEMMNLCPSSCKFCGQKPTEQRTSKKPGLLTTAMPESKNTGHELKPMTAKITEYYDGYIEQRVNITSTNPYDKAAHWFKVKDKNLLDVRNRRIKAIILSDEVTKATDQLGPVLSLNNEGDYINIRGFGRECITDPDECARGLSIGFWLRLTKGKYILSGGSYADEPRGTGFKIYHDVNATQLRVEIATKNKKWIAVIHKVPKTWCYFLLSWSRQTGLRIFINGVFVLQDKGSKERIVPININRENNRVFIAKQDSSEQIQQPIQFDIGHLGVWYEEFDDGNVSKAFEMSIIDDTKSKECCLRKEQSECYLNPCHKFKKTAKCEQNCICPKVEKLRICTHRVFSGECIDNRADCQILGAQKGYCDFFQKDMEKLCPASCGYCVPKKPKMATQSSKKMKKEIVIFLTIGCAAGIILLLLIALYSWKVYRSKFTGAFIPSFKTSTLLDAEEYGDEKWTKKYIDSSYFVIKDVPPKKRALPIIPSKPAQPKYQPPEF